MKPLRHKGYLVTTGNDEVMTTKSFTYRSSSSLLQEGVKP